MILTTDRFGELWDKLEHQGLTSKEYFEIDDMIDYEFKCTLSEGRFSKSFVSDLYDEYFILVTKQYDQWIKRLQDQKRLSTQEKSKIYYEQARAGGSMKEESRN